MKKFTSILALVISMLSFTNAKADKLPIIDAKSTIGHYSVWGGESYPASNAVDGNYSTWFWTSDSPGVGYNFTVTLSEVSSVSDIKLYFADGDLATDGAVVEVSTDDATWTEVGTFNGSEYAGSSVTIDAKGAQAKYVRLRFTQKSGAWFKLMEFEVYETLAASRTISATVNIAEGGTVTINGGEGEVTAEGEIKLVAVPNYGYKFVNWTVGGEVVSSSADYTDNSNGDKEYVAVFEKLTDTAEWYASIAKPSFTKVGNTTYIAAATLTGGVESEVTGIQATVGQTCVTGAIEVEKGAQLNLNITYQLNWGDLAIYQIDNDGATKEYGYYYGSWEPNGDTKNVVNYLVEDGIAVSEVVDGVCTATFPITINENHNVGDVIIVRAITGVTNNVSNSAYEQGIVEGGYVDFLFVVAESKSYTLSVCEAAHATLFLDYPVALTDGVEAYIVKQEGINDGYITMTQINGTIPANAGVIIKAAEGDYTFNYSMEEPADVTGNLLKGSVADEYIEGAAYVLGNEDGVGFYIASLNKNATGGDGDTHFVNNANRAYLPASVLPAEVQGAASFSFRFGEGTTGVEKVEIRNEKEEIYDLTGRRVEAVTAAGIYIVDGVKRVIR